MKVLMLSHSDGVGGAGRASYRLLQSLDAAGVDARMHVDFQNTSDPRVFRNSGPLKDVARRLRITTEEIPAYLARFPEPRLFSPGIAHAINARRINASDADVVNLQWVNFGYLSTRQIGRITKPLTWSMHDMWAFTGGMNYTDDSSEARWRHDFEAPIPPEAESWWDVDRWVWKRKRRQWQRPITLIASSSWMAGLAAESPLTREWPVSVIPNPVDVDTYRPDSQKAAREQLGIPKDKKAIIAFFPRNLQDPRKGFDLFLQSLHHLGTDASIHVAVAGHSGPPGGIRLPDISIHWLGYLDDESAIAAYRAADVVAVPSRQDNSPQTATESLSCGTPVVAFDSTGLPDFVQHLETGYLASAFDPQDFARGLALIANDPELRDRMSQFARDRAVQQWSYTTVGQAHRDLFESLRIH